MKCNDVWRMTQQVMELRDILEERGTWDIHLRNLGQAHLALTLIWRELVQEGKENGQEGGEWEL